MKSNLGGIRSYYKFTINLNYHDPNIAINVAFLFLIRKGYTIAAKALVSELYRLKLQLYLISLPQVWDAGERYQKII